MLLLYGIRSITKKPVYIKKINIAPGQVALTKIIKMRADGTNRVNENRARTMKADFIWNKMTAWVPIPC